MTHSYMAHLQGFYQYPRQPRKRFNYWIWIVIALFLFLLLINPARAEEPNWNTLIPIIIQIESSGNPNAISEDGCIGLMQISPVVLEEYLSYIRATCSFNPPCDYCNFADLYNAETNKFIGTWYLKRIWFDYLPHYKIPQTIDNLLWAWNAGIGNVVKGIKPKETRDFIKKYHKLAKEK